LTKKLAILDVSLFDYAVDVFSASQTALVEENTAILSQGYSKIILKYKPETGVLTGVQFPKIFKVNLDRVSVATKLELKYLGLPIGEFLKAVIK